MNEELILYATPTGALGASCDTYWGEAMRVGLATTAQSYPPHCSLTGFFLRASERVPAICAEVDEVMASLDSPSTVVESLKLAALDRWVGLEMRAPWLQELTAALVGRHRLGSAEDPLRPKEWLHLSLAYGDGLVEAGHLELARHLFGDEPAAGWSVGLWRRRQGRWTQLTSVEVADEHEMNWCWEDR